MSSLKDFNKMFMEQCSQLNEFITIARGACRSWEMEKSSEATRQQYYDSLAEIALKETEVKKQELELQSLEKAVRLVKLKRSLLDEEKKKSNKHLSSENPKSPKSPKVSDLSSDDEKEIETDESDSS